MTISEIIDKKINIGYSKVLIKNMGPEGLCLVSDQRLPVNSDIILKIKTELFGEEINLYGHPIWSEEMLDNNSYVYGIEFILDDDSRNELIEVLNQFHLTTQM